MTRSERRRRALIIAAIVLTVVFLAGFAISMVLRTIGIHRALQQMEQEQQEMQSEIIYWE